MNPAEIRALRLENQRLTGVPFPTPAAAVRHLGAVQSQDYAGAKWALSRRTGDPGCGDAELDKLFDAGKILRTHLMRTTWHFVDPADARWMLALMAPRGRQAMSFMNRKEGLTADDFKRSKKVLEKALRDGQHKTRNELAEILKKGGVEPGQGIRLAHIMMDAELEGLIISGPRKGKQFTYGLLEERAPKSRTLPREEGLAELTRRYFTGHGPAQPADFAWWSGLTLAEVKKGIEAVKSQLDSVTVDGKTFLWGRGKRGTAATRIAKNASKEPVIHLLPNYDEYFIGYKDRSSIGDRIKASKAKPEKDAFNLHILFVDGQVAGGWKRDMGKTATLAVTPVGKLSPAEKKALAAEAARFGTFAGMEAKLTLPRVLPF
jgi:hypothetical protein